MNIQQAGLLQAPGQGNSHWFAEDLYTFKAVGEDTGKAYTLCEVVVAPQGGGAPPHRHSQDSESFYILEGELEFYIDGEKIIATPGMFIYSPQGQIHQFTNKTYLPVKMLVWLTPSGFENFIADVGKPINQVISGSPLTRADLENILATAPKYGIEILPPPAES
ncbi:cupin domain-containing protein [Nostoc sp. FACHB-152]|uniref:cupin domain-containing protein n=1 Tax=unclassified Nostoc TaxID=2593658 RepID=UPI001685FCAC|nr:MULTISPECIES: cupin domain-containing protein [unclassified Nostoc]MBD2451951.1 cupin domain-containing protein [Nostoc sp. FACHB-152]MBD2473043.1 cupin domain-containing protein [Nostoc sp. FACHB-145]